MTASRRLVGGGAAIAWAAVALLVPGAVLGQAREDVRASLSAMAREAGAPLRVSLSRASDGARFVGTEANAGVRLGLAANASAEERSRLFLARHAAAFGIADERELVLSRRNEPDALGVERVRYRQTVGGVPVTGGEVSVHLRGDVVVATHASLLPSEAARDLVLRPSIASAVAAERARALLRELGAAEATISAGELQVFQRGLLEGRDGPTRLAWFFEASGPEVREYVWVDAHDGGILLHFDQLGSARDRRVHDAQDDDGLPGLLVRDEDDPATGDDDIDLAFDYLGDTYDYFFSQHGRDSYDGAGAILRASVRFCPLPVLCPYENAFWNGTQMVFGEDFTAADDVVAHELTHAITEKTANLFYYMQSGALNESYSDIFGETVDLTNGAGDDSAAVRWLIGEELPIGQIRDLYDPTAFNDPGKMTDDAFFYCQAPGTDKGGVHINSGVPNHAYALLVDGGAYNGHTVTGIGLTKAAAIEYRALTQYLLSASDFLDNYQALRQSCQDLIGTLGISAATCQEVDDALEAVEMYFPWPCNEPQPSEPPLCPSGGTASPLFATDFEDDTSGEWELQVLGAGDIHWDEGLGDDGLYSSLFATSGTRHLWGNNRNLAGDSAAAMTFDVAIPAGGARLQFAHSFGFQVTAQGNFAGGVLQYSTDDGGSWLDAGPMMVQGMTYRGKLRPSSPLGAAQAFVRDSHGYTATQLDLAPLAGQDVRFRFRMLTQVPIPAGQTQDYGWFVDDVRIYTCDGAVVLVDQTDLISTHGTNSQEFEAANAAFDSSGAADFTTAAGIAVGGVDVPGFYATNEIVGVGGATPRLDVSLHANAGGLPGAALESCSFDGLRAGIDFADTGGTFRVELPERCCVPAGTHWLVVQADMDFVSGGQWYWKQRTAVSGLPMAWQNPLDGFATGCTSWGTGPPCVAATDPELAFALWQGASPPVPPTLVLENEIVTTTELHEAGTITAETYELESPARVTLRGGTSVALRDGFRVESGAYLRVAIGPATGCP